jgi:hypothetical protein
VKAKTDHSSKHLPVPTMNQLSRTAARYLIGPEPSSGDGEGNEKA